MFSKMNCIYFCGMEGKEVTAEADVSDGLPGYSLVGYLASEVREGGDRVRTAIRNLRLSLPPKRITINLSPADFRKEGTGFDLAIAAAILAGYGCFQGETLKDAVLFGELGLDGKIKGVPGTLLVASYARMLGYKRIFLPEENIREAAVIEGIRLIAVKNLGHFFNMMTGRKKILEYDRTAEPTQKEALDQYPMDFSEINGQPLLRRAAEVAAAGMHNMLIIGPAGTGKTMVAKRIPTIMPRLSEKERIEISKLYSISGLLSDKEPLVSRRPFRNPHHTVSPQALTGGGSRPKPGEISLATGGILFLDEFPEMGRASLEALRQPLEERQVTITRVQGTVCYPASFQLVAAMNPCPCGHYPNLESCRCTPGQIRKYLGRISGPLLDRIDICVEAAPVSYQEIRKNQENEPSGQIRKRVEQAREIQKRRFEGLDIQCNGEMQGGQIASFCRMEKGAESLMEQVYEKLGISVRMYGRILKVARTVADLEQRENIADRDICEAVSYVRTKERFWKG